MSISRREALALLGSGIGVGALASCSAQSSSQEASASPTDEASTASTDNGATDDVRLTQANHNVRYDSKPRDLLVLLHISDVHGNGEALGRALTWADAHATLIDDVLATGDLAHKEFQDGMEYWNEINGSNRVLTCIGNHDVYNTRNLDRKTYDKVSVTDAAARYIDPYCSSWGDIDHETGTTWYAKDYPESDIRLIVLDCVLYMGKNSGSQADAQDTWLESVLADAASRELAVVVAEHFPLDKKSMVECSWVPYNRKLTCEEFLDTRVTDRVQAFIDAGGCFVCYLCGHTHHDAAHILPDHPEQFALCVPCTSDNYDEAKWGDMDRSQEATRDAFNVVFVDTANELVKVVRIGADRDLALQHRNTLCWSYGAHRLVHAD